MTKVKPSEIQNMNEHITFNYPNKKTIDYRSLDLNDIESEINDIESMIS